jgi:hypothetical protein
MDWSCAFLSWAGFVYSTAIGAISPPSINGYQSVSRFIYQIHHCETDQDGMHAGKNYFLEQKITIQ